MHNRAEIQTEVKRKRTRGGRKESEAIHNIGRERTQREQRMVTTILYSNNSNNWDETAVTIIQAKGAVTRTKRKDKNHKTTESNTKSERNKNKNRNQDKNKNSVIKNNISIYSNINEMIKVA